MAQKNVIELIVCPSTETSPRQSEADILELKDDRLLLAYTDFYTKGKNDFSPSRISGKLSPDKGRTWTDPFIIQENIAKINGMEPTLLRLGSGEIALFYIHKNSKTDCKPYLKKSRDDGKTWSEAVCMTRESGYHIMNNDRVIKLNSGRLLAPVAKATETVSFHCKSFCLFSDDNGQTWQTGETKIKLPGIAGAQEPGVVELKDSSILRVIRTSIGYTYKSYSRDGGVRWTKAQPTHLVSPVSPATIKRIPTTGDLLMTWNNSPNRRCPLDIRRFRGRRRDLEEP